MNIPHLVDFLATPQIDPIKTYTVQAKDPELENLINDVLGSDSLPFDNGENDEILQNLKVIIDSTNIINASLQVLSKMLDNGGNIFKESLEKMESIDICQELYVEAEAISPIVRS